MFVFPRRARGLDLAMLLVVSLAVSAPTIRSIVEGPCIATAGPSDFRSILRPVAQLREGVRAHGAPPLWRTGELYGLGTAGDPSQRILYPPMAIYALCDMPLAEHLFVLCHTLLLAWGMYALIRGERRSPLAALAGAIMVGLSFKVATYLLCGWDTVYGAVAYVPLALHLFLRSLRSKSLAPGALLGVVLAVSCLAGTPQIVVSLGLGLPVAGLLALGRHRTRERLARLALTLVLGFGIAFLLAAPGLLASLASSAASDRAGSYGTSIGRNVLAALTVPDLTHEDLSWETSNYLGLLAFPLAGAGIASTRRKLSFALWVFVIFLILAAGPATPIGEALELVPVVGKLSYLTRLLWIVAVAEAMLAARGIDALVAVGDGGRRRRLAIGLAAGSFATILAFAIPGQERHDALSPLVGALGLAVLLASPLLPFVPRRRRFALLSVLVVATGIELLVLTERVLVRVPWEPLVRPSLVERALSAEPFARVMPISPPGRTLDTVVPCQARVTRADGYSPLHPRATVAYVHAIGGQGAGAWSPYVWINRLARLDLLGIGATHVASRSPVEGLEVVAEADEPLWLPAGHEVTERVVLQRIPGALPRAYVMRRARSVAASEQQGRMVAASPFEGTRSLLVDGPVPAELEGENDAPLPAAITRYEPDAVTVEASVPAPGGFLVLLDADDPAWRATVDGLPVPIRRANAIFRAVKLTGGTHAVAFRIGCPTPFLVGLGLSAAGAILVIFLLTKRRPAIVR
jgi:hypothetical protein